MKIENCKLKIERPSRHDSHQGFSVLELLACVTILAILALILVPRVWENSTESKKQACYSNKGNIEAQVQLWYRNKGSWPATNLSNMLPTSSPAEYNYFPAGLPVCPVDGSAYTIDATTHQVVGHTH